MPYFEDKFENKYGILTHPQGIDFVDTPNHSGGFKPEYLVLHYTASPSLESSLNWFKQKSSQVSAHFLIDWDGSITQTIRTTRTAWHAGVSNYDGISGLNTRSIGIELVNFGHMDILSEGRYRTYFGKTVKNGDILTSDQSDWEDEMEIVEAVHPIMGGPKKAWVLATSDQVESVISLGRYLMEEYDLKECLLHQEISRGRKWDTGPTLSESVIAKIEGGSVKTQPAGTFRVSANAGLNLRFGPAVTEAIIAQLPNNALVTLIEPVSKTTPFVKIRTAIDSMEGWVHSGFLVKA